MPAGPEEQEKQEQEQQRAPEQHEGVPPQQPPAQPPQEQQCPPATPAIEEAPVVAGAGPLPSSRIPYMSAIGGPPLPLPALPPPPHGVQLKPEVPPAHAAGAEAGAGVTVGLAPNGIASPPPPPPPPPPPQHQQPPPQQQSQSGRANPQTNHFRTNSGDSAFSLASSASGVSDALGGSLSLSG
jgi:hypothetical protein